jgi:hypothetical protein
MNIVIKDEVDLTYGSGSSTTSRMKTRRSFAAHLRTSHADDPSIKVIVERRAGVGWVAAE